MKIQYDRIPVQQERERKGRDVLSQFMIKSVNAVSSVPTTFWYGLGIVTAVVTLGVGFGMCSRMFNTSENSGLTRSTREVGGTSNNTFPLTNNSTIDNNQQNMTADYSGISTQASLNGLLRAADYLEGNNSTEPQNRTLTVGLLFSDEACETSTLSIIFDDDGSGNNKEALERAENATVWKSEVSLQRQIKLKLEEFETALGALFTPKEAGGCPAKLVIDPTLFSETQKAEAHAQKQNIEVNTALNQESSITCRPISGTVTGKDMFGNRISEGRLNVCKNNEQKSHHREKRDTDPPQRRNNTSSLASNMTQEELHKLQTLIQTIREENCPNNLTVIDGVYGSSESIGSEAFRLVTDSIKFLCPSTTIIPLSQANTTLTEDLLGVFGLTQLLEGPVLKELSEGVLIVADQFTNALPQMDFSTLNNVIEMLNELGVPVISTETESWTDFIPGVFVDKSIAESLVRSKRSIPLGPEASDGMHPGVASAIGISIGALILLIPSILVLKRIFNKEDKSIECIEGNSDEMEMLNQEEVYDDVGEPELETNNSNLSLMGNRRDSRLLNNTGNSEEESSSLLNFRFQSTSQLSLPNLTTPRPELQFSALMKSNIEITPNPSSGAIPKNTSRSRLFTFQSNKDLEFSLSLRDLREARACAPVTQSKSMLNIAVESGTQTPLEPSVEICEKSLIEQQDDTILKWPACKKESSMTDLLRISEHSKSKYREETEEENDRKLQELALKLEVMRNKSKKLRPNFKVSP